MRKMLLMFALGAMAVLMLAPTALAQQGHTEDVFDCADFATQIGAQALLDPEDPSKLDDDGDGKACEPGPGGKAEDGTKLATKTGGDVDCIDFPSQKAAQARLKAKPSDADKLDHDNDGVACRIVPVPYKNGASDRAPVAAARSETRLSCDDFEYQQEAQMILLRDEADPNGLDDDDDGLACEEDLPGFAANEEVIEAAPSLAPLEGADSWLLLVVAGGLAGPGALGLAAWRRHRSAEG